MVSVLFILLFVVGILFSLVTGETEVLNKSLSAAPKEAMFIFFETAYTLVFWSGLLQICVDCGLLNTLSRGFIMLIHPLFRKIDKKDVALQYISLNLISNMFSVGSAATPFGLKAFQRLNELNDNRDIASDEMILFMNLNSSCICFLPVSLISTRTMYGGSQNALVMVGLVVMGVILMTFSILVNRMCKRYART